MTFNATYNAVEDVPLVKDAAAGVLLGATVPPLTVKLTKGPSHGSLDLKLDGSFTCTPAQDFNGADGFEFEVSDGNKGTAIAAAIINVGACVGMPGGLMGCQAIKARGGGGTAATSNAL
jgi:hypothetical protein